MRLLQIVFVAGLLAFFVSETNAEILLDWNFDDPAGTSLSQVENEGSEYWAAFEQDIGSSATTGDGVFRIQTPSEKGLRRRIVKINY